jgi:hypothetical protein
MPTPLQDPTWIALVNQATTFTINTPDQILLQFLQTVFDEFNNAPPNQACNVQTSICAFSTQPAKSRYRGTFPTPFNIGDFMVVSAFRRVAAAVTRPALAFINSPINRVTTVDDDWHAAVLYATQRQGAIRRQFHIITTEARYHEQPLGVGVHVGQELRDKSVGWISIAKAAVHLIDGDAFRHRRVTLHVLRGQAGGNQCIPEGLQVMAEIAAHIRVYGAGGTAQGVLADVDHGGLMARIGGSWVLAP